MNRIRKPVVAAMIVMAVAGGWIANASPGRSGEYKPTGTTVRPAVRTPRPAKPIHTLNMKFKGERAALRNEFLSARRALLDQRKAGTITKAEYVERKKALIDQFKKDREALRNQYKLDKKELQTTLKEEGKEDREDLKDDEGKDTDSSTPPSTDQ